MSSFIETSEGIFAEESKLLTFQCKIFHWKFVLCFVGSAIFISAKIMLVSPNYAKSYANMIYRGFWLF